MGKPKFQKKKEDHQTPKQKLDPKKLLGRLLRSDTGIISKAQLQELSFFDLFQLVEEISQYILSNPEKNLVHLQTLFHLTEWDDDLIVKVSLLSTVEIFKNICPLYQIDEEKIQEAFHTKISKDVMNPMNSQDEIIKKASKNPEKSEQDNEVENNVVSDLRYTAVKCFSEIIIHLSHFNYSQQVITFTVKKVTNFNPKTKEAVLKAIESVFTDVAHSSCNLFELGSRNFAEDPMKIQILKEIIKLMNKTAEAKLPDSFVDVINKLEIDTKAEKILKQENDLKQEKKKEKREHFKQKFKEKMKKKNDPNYDEKNKKKDKSKSSFENKMKKEIDSELKETRGDFDPKTIAKYNSEILLKIFSIYFKILKRPQNTKFFNSALNGIIKFIHYVKLDLISGIMESLNETSSLLRENHLKKKRNYLLMRFTTLYTYQEIIKAPGNLLEIDEKGIIMIFYQIVLDTIKNPAICKEYGANEKKMFVTLMQKIFVEKRQFSMETVASFIKLLAKLSLMLHEESHFCLTLLFVIYKLLNKYPKMLNLLDPDNEGFGLNIFNLEIDDPQGTNALNSNIIEEMESLFKQTKNQEVKDLAMKIKKGEKINMQILAKTPLEFYLVGRN